MLVLLFLTVLLFSLASSQDFQSSNFPSQGGGGGGWWRNGGMGRWLCHYPRIIDRLSPDAQAKLRLIWGNWREGMDCTQERTETRQFFFTLPQEERMKIFQGMGGGRIGHRFGDHWPCHYPRMIDRLPVDAQAKLRAIWGNWREGKDCTQERTQMRQLFFTLPQEAKMKIFQAMRERHPEMANWKPPGGSQGGWPSGGFRGMRQQ